MSEALIIAYGNPIRGDDGAGWRIAAEAAAHLPAGAVILTTHQLTPEIAEPASQARVVVFVDAAEGGEPGEVTVLPVVPGTANPRAFTHQMDPDGLLAMAQSLFGRRPPAYLVTINGESFELTEELSATVAAAIPEAARLVAELSAQSPELP